LNTMLLLLLAPESLDRWEAVERTDPPPDTCETCETSSSLSSRPEEQPRSRPAEADLARPAGDPVGDAAEGSCEFLREAYAEEPLRETGCEVGMMDREGARLTRPSKSLDSRRRLMARLGYAWARLGNRSYKYSHCVAVALRGVGLLLYTRQTEYAIYSIMRLLQRQPLHSHRDY
jgi:hypothetical protein